MQAEVQAAKAAAEAQRDELEDEHASLATNAATLADATLKAQVRGRGGVDSWMRCGSMCCSATEVLRAVISWF